VAPGARPLQQQQPLRLHLHLQLEGSLLWELHQAAVVVAVASA
jgi:hypothetical protein